MCPPNCETLERKRREAHMKKRLEMHFKRNMAFCSGQIPLWSEGGTVGVAGIITGIMR